MRVRKIICFAVIAMLAATAMSADETVIVSNILGPEGPLYVDGNLYYVGWVSNTLSKWDGKTTTVLNHTPGCGHNGLALTKQKTFLLACTEEQGAILELDLTGKQLRRWDADKGGKPFEGGINDIVVTGNGGAYATLFVPANPHPLSRGKNSMNPKNFFGSPYHDGICGFEPVDSGVTGSPGSLDTSSYRSR